MTHQFQSVACSSRDDFREELQKITKAYGVRLAAIGYKVISEQGEPQVAEQLAIIEFPATLSPLEVRVLSTMMLHRVLSLTKVQCVVRRAV